MIEYIEGDIFESPAQVIVNTVNTVGVMGKGIALSFKKRYPEMYERYKAVCEQGLLKTGKLMLFYEADYWLLLFPTKESWRQPSRLEYIEAGLQKFVQTYAAKGITSIAFPRLGCGNGELKWEDVKPLMEQYLKKLPISVYIYLGTNPDEEPEHKTPRKTIAWLKRNAKDMSFTGVKDDLRHNCAILPYEFKWNNKQVSMKYQDTSIIFSWENMSAEKVVSEDELYRVWDNLRSLTVISIESATEQESLLFALLHSAGYLSKIKIYNSSTQQMTDGYQLNAGVGRMSVYHSK